MKKIIFIILLLIFIVGCAEQIEDNLEEPNQGAEIISPTEEESVAEPEIIEEVEIFCPNYDGNKEECLIYSECEWGPEVGDCNPINGIGENYEDDGMGGDEEKGFASELEKDLPDTIQNQICKQLPLTKDLSPGDRHYCFAVVNNNPEFCEFIIADNENDIEAKNEKNLCLAHANKDSSYCKKMSDNEAKHDCYFGLSMISGDINFCDDINYDKNDRQLCYWSFANALYWEGKSDKITIAHCNKLPAGSEDRNTCLAFKEKDVSLCKNNINCLTCFEQPASFCTTGKGKSLKYCIRDRAMSSKDISTCETLTGEYKDDCFGDFAGHITQDISTCDKISSDFAKHTCYKDVAVQSGTNFLFNLYN